MAEVLHQGWGGEGGLCSTDVWQAAWEGQSPDSGLQGALSGMSQETVTHGFEVFDAHLHYRTACGAPPTSVDGLFHSCLVCVFSFAWAGSNWGNKDLADLDFGNGDEDSSDSGEEN